MAGASSASVYASVRASSSSKLPHAADPGSSPIFTLGIVGIEQVLLALPGEADARAARAACRTFRQVTLSTGFGTLWRATHVVEATAKVEAAKFKEIYASLEFQQLETEVAQTAPTGTEWRRVLPPRPSPQQSKAVALTHHVTPSASSSRALDATTARSRLSSSSIHLATQRSRSRSCLYRTS